MSKPTPQDMQGKNFKMIDRHSRISFIKINKPQSMSSMIYFYEVDIFFEPIKGTLNCCHFSWFLKEIAQKRIRPLHYVNF